MYEGLMKTEIVLEQMKYCNEVADDCLKLGEGGQGAYFNT
jgi:hypothetical protein